MEVGQWNQISEESSKQLLWNGTEYEQKENWSTEVIHRNENVQMAMEKPKR